MMAKLNFQPSVSHDTSGIILIW